MFKFVLFIKNSRTDLIPPTVNRQQLPDYSTIRLTGIDEKVVSEVESALRTMREHTKDSENNNIFTRLVIEEPEEFRGIEYKYMIELKI